MTLLISGIIGAVIMIAFLAFMAGWVKAPPLIVIILIVIALMIYDFYLEVRASRNNGGNNKV